MTLQKEIQLGKKGVNVDIINDINIRLEKYRNVTLKISVLKSARPNGKEDIKKYSDEIVQKLGDKYTAKIIGFSIFLRKWRKAR